MKRYDNGELITQKRMEEEDWYYTLYQPFLEFATVFHCKYEKSRDVDALYKYVIKSYEKIFKEKLTDANLDRILRWSVLNAERMDGFTQSETYKKLKKLGEENNKNYQIMMSKMYNQEHEDIERFAKSTESITPAPLKNNK